MIQQWMKRSRVRWDATEGCKEGAQRAAGDALFDMEKYKRRMWKRWMDQRNCYFGSEKVQLNVVCPGASLGKKKTMTTKEKFVVEENEKADELCWRKHIDTSSTPRGPTPPRRHRRRKHHRRRALTLRRDVSLDIEATPTVHACSVR